MAVGDGVRQLNQQLGGDPGRGAGRMMFLQPGRQRGAGTIGRGDVAESVGFAGLVDRHDMGMVQSGRSAGFTMKTLQQCRLRQRSQPRHLQGDLPAELGVGGQVHNPEASLAQDAVDVEPPQSCGRPARDVDGVPPRPWPHATQQVQAFQFRHPVRRRVVSGAAG